MHASLSLDNRQTPGHHAAAIVGQCQPTAICGSAATPATIGYPGGAAEHRNDTRRVLTASYLFHVPNSKLSLLANYIHSNSNVVSTLGNTSDVVGQAATSCSCAGCCRSVPRTDVHAFAVGGFRLQARHRGESACPAQFSNTPVTYYPFSVAYQAELDRCAIHHGSAEAARWSGRFASLGSNDTLSSTPSASRRQRRTSSTPSSDADAHAGIALWHAGLCACRGPRPRPIRWSATSS